MQFSDLEQRGIVDLQSIENIPNHGIGYMKGYKNKLREEEDKIPAEWIIIQSKKVWNK